MASSKSFASTINKWRILLGGYNKHKSDLSFAENDTAELTKLTEKAEQLNVKQEQLKTDLAKITDEMKICISNGNAKYSSVMRYAKGKYGPKSIEIKDFMPKGEA